MKRTSSKKVCFVLILSLCTGSALFAADVCNDWLQVGSAWAGPCCGGESTTITIPVMLHNCAPAEAFHVAVRFDPTVLSLPDDSAVAWVDVSEENDWLSVDVGDNYASMGGVIGFGGGGGYEYSTLPVPENEDSPHTIAELTFTLLDAEAGEYALALDDSVTEPQQRIFYTVDGQSFTEADGLELRDGALTIAPSCLDIDMNGSSNLFDLTYIFNVLNGQEYVAPELWRQYYDIPPDAVLTEIIESCRGTGKYDIDVNGSANLFDLTYIFNVLNGQEYVAPELWRQYYDIPPDEELEAAVNALLPPVSCDGGGTPKGKTGTNDTPASLPVLTDAEGQLWYEVIDQGESVEVLLHLATQYPVHYTEGVFEFDGAAFELEGLEKSGMCSADLVQFSAGTKPGLAVFTFWNAAGDALLPEGRTLLGSLFFQRTAVAGTPETAAYGALSARSLLFGPGRVDIPLGEPKLRMPFVRGDVNSDSTVNIADVAVLLSFLFQGADVPCHDAADVNSDLELNIADAVFALRFLFASGAVPGAPYPECQRVQTETAVLGCGESSCDG